MIFALKLKGRRGDEEGGREGERSREGWGRGAGANLISNLGVEGLFQFLSKINIDKFVNLGGLSWEWAGIKIVVYLSLVCGGGGGRGTCRGEKENP